MGVEDQQLGLAGTGGVLPGQLAASDCRNIGITGVAALFVDKVTYILTDQFPTEVGLDFMAQPALAAGLGTAQDQDLHALTSAGSRRHSRQPCTAIKVNRA
ncbi:hypothetical protein D3C80_1543380 [compost metagenome]